jgi:branched-subunit amino acid aminotransferase/4-amino-4-deoxychorismate lyase
LTEGPGFNVAVVIDSVIHIPRQNVLGGITMHLVQQLCDAHGINYKYSDIDAGMLEAATDMFITSTAGDIVPVVEFESQKFSVSPEQYALKKFIQKAWTLDGYSTLLRTV